MMAVRHGKRPELARALEAAHEQLEHDGSIEIELQSLDRLLGDRDGVESGADYLAGVLESARRLPAGLVVRVVLPLRPRTAEEGVAAFRKHCRARAEVSWREAMAVRRTGLRQLTPSMLAAFVAGAVAAGASALAESAGSSLVVPLLYAVAGLCLISAWVILWMPVEEVLFDWRPKAHVAEGYDLLARASVEIVERKPVRPRAIQGGARRAPRRVPVSR